MACASFAPCSPHAGSPVTRPPRGRPPGRWPASWRGPGSRRVCSPCCRTPLGCLPANQEPSAQGVSPPVDKERIKGKRAADRFSGALSCQSSFPQQLNSDAACRSVLAPSLCTAVGVARHALGVEGFPQGAVQALPPYTADFPSLLHHPKLHHASVRDTAGVTAGNRGMWPQHLPPFPLAPAPARRVSWQLSRRSGEGG